MHYRATSMPLGLVPTLLSDAAHEIQNAVVLDLATNDLSESSVPPLPCLLSIIVGEPEGTLDSRYRDIRNARALLRDCEELRKMLQVGWMTKSFNEIRNLEILRSTAIVTSSISSSRNELHTGDHGILLPDITNRLSDEKLRPTLEDLSSYLNLKDLHKLMESLPLQIQESSNALTRVHVRIAEAQNLNRHSHTSHLPHEILSCIFESGIPLSPMREKPFEIDVSHVCRQWRTVALQTPRLWTNIYVNTCSSHVELMDLYLKRSGQCLLDILFETEGETCPEYLKLETKIFMKHLVGLVPHVARWRWLSIDGGQQPISSFSPLFELYAPALEGISIGPKNVYSLYFPDLSRANLFSRGAPLLSSVALHGHFVETIRLPLDSVTSLRMINTHCTFPFKVARKALTRIRSLTHLHVGGNLIFHSSHLKPIELPFVRVLIMELNKCTLPCFDSPAVEELVLRNINKHTSSLLESSQRKYPALRSLKLVGCYRSSDSEPDTSSIIKFITSLPTIQILSFDRMYPALLSVLLQPGDNLPWPGLHTVTIMHPPWNEEEDKPAMTALILAPVIQFIEHCIKIRRPISCVKLSDPLMAHAEGKHLAQLRELVDLKSARSDISQVW